MYIPLSVDEHQFVQKAHPARANSHWERGRNSNPVTTCCCCIVCNHLIFMLTITLNCRQKSCFSFLSVPAIGYKSSLVPKHHKRFYLLQKYILLHYNIVSRMCFHLYYFHNVSPLKISNHNAFYNFLLGYNALCSLDKMDRN